MRVVLVTGGRAYEDEARVYEELDQEQPDLVIHGGARSMIPGKVYSGGEVGYFGADWHASRWCDHHDIPQLKAPYLRKHDRRGGPIRNDWMVTFANSLMALPSMDVVVLAFPGGNGTADTVEKALRKGLPVRRVV